MKYTHCLLAICMCLAFSQCSKERATINTSISEQLISDSALVFLQHSLSFEDYGNLDLSSIRILNNRGQVVAFRVAEKLSSDRKFILLRKGASTFEGNKVDFSNLSLTSEKAYGGEIALKTLEGRVLKTITVKDNKVVKTTDLLDRVTRFQQSETLNGVNDTIAVKTLDEVFISGSGPSPGPDYASMYWLFNQYSGYENMYYTNYEVGVGTDSAIKDSVNQVSVAPEYVSPDHPVNNIYQELKCFTLSSQNTYSVSVNVNQPYPSTRELTNLSAEHQAGHTFVTLKEQFPDGTVMVRNIGFYPMNYAKPNSGVDKSVFGEDSETPYSVSLTMSLSAVEFGVFRTSIYEQQGRTYVLEGFNCTNSVMTSFSAINVSLPATIGKNALFSGNNPADLGEDIRTMDINKFSTENGGRKVVRSLSNQNDLKAPARQGGC